MAFESARRTQAKIMKPRCSRSRALKKSPSSYFHRSVHVKRFFNLVLEALIKAIIAIIYYWDYRNILGIEIL